MFTTQLFFYYLLVMASVTYLIRAIPFILVRKQIKNAFLRSFLSYIPYAVLASMTFPAIIYSTASIPSALIGLTVAIFFAYRKKGLLFVAVSSCITVYIAEFLIHLSNL